ncbi:N-acetyldiaminopimelate deacetylase, partial [Streptococcus mitis]|nr:N-acetyldiaminopimelate deacetylase [Streptococcus mitis]
GYLLSKVDGVMFWLGIDSPYALHHPQMSPKEEALAIGVDAVSSFLKKKAAE